MISRFQAWHLPWYVVNPFKPIGKTYVPTSTSSPYLDIFLDTTWDPLKPLAKRIVPPRHLHLKYDRVAHAVFRVTVTQTNWPRRNLHLGRSLWILLSIMQTMFDMQLIASRRSRALLAEACEQLHTNSHCWREYRMNPHTEFKKTHENHW